MLVVIPNGTDIDIQTVGDTHLQEHAPQHPTETSHQLVRVEWSGFIGLCQEGLGTINRSGEDGGEEGDIVGKTDDISFGQDLPVVDVQYITHQLERKETQSDRYHQMECRPTHMEP